MRFRLSTVCSFGVFITFGGPQACAVAVRLALLQGMGYTPVEAKGKAWPRRIESNFRKAL
jgi:hypothetical protein